MKVLTSTLSALAMASAVFCQSALVHFPTDGTSVSAGSSLNVDIIRPNSLSSSQEVGVVLGLASCNPRCLAANLSIGRILYNGDFNPQFGNASQPHQNITVQIPSDTPKGAAQLNFAHFFLLGASLSPDLESSSVSITIV
ncbi:hypothetical protein VKT23_015157 [Stygiomarasmius scandens]|uniref:Secreted protein n=1 Tax=Marasmiellus scandens TaxID=2682957 RepID=A0ABR1J043_9AGAR